MSTIHIDRILETCIRRGGRDVQIVPGQLLKLRFADDQTRDLLAGKPLDPDECRALFVSVAPDDNQAEFDRAGFTQFDFKFGDVGKFHAAARKTDAGLVMNLRLLNNNDPDRN